MLLDEEDLILEEIISSWGFYQNIEQLQIHGKEDHFHKDHKIEFMKRDSSFALK